MPPDLREQQGLIGRHFNRVDDAGAEVAHHLTDDRGALGFRPLKVQLYADPSGEPREDVLEEWNSVLAVGSLRCG
jgi:hypothetical protein